MKAISPENNGADVVLTLGIGLLFLVHYLTVKKMHRNGASKIFNFGVVLKC
jgi:hypothetical protein